MARARSHLIASALLCSCAEATGPAELGLVDRTRESGVDFVHASAASGKKLLVEINAGPVTLLDHDQDGNLDVFFGQGAPLPGFDPSGADFRDRLYRNLGGFRFADVTEETGASEPGYTFHAAAPDVDADGDPDLYLSNFEQNRWLQNDGGVFEDATSEWGAGCELWSTCAAFADFDRDGDLDLYVANYCIYPLDHKGCGSLERGEEWRAYCNPDEFPGAPDRFYVNQSGCFLDRTEAAGMGGADGTALGLAISDYDLDGDVDLFVANDGRPNFLWRNEGQLRFTEVAAECGVAVAENGLSEACMGTDFADVDGDLDFDLLVTNLAMETNTLYRNEGPDWFDDRSTWSGLGPPSLRFVGFGCEWFDVENDGDPDVMVVNGHILDNVELYQPSETFEQPPHLYLNDGGRFVEQGEEHGSYFHGRHVGRGLAIGDLDNDGDFDVVVGHNNAAPALLENRMASGPWLGLKLVGAGKNLAAIGARVEVSSGARVQVEELRGTSSYAAFHDLRLLFGGVGARASVTVHWPDGRTSRHPDLETGRYHELASPDP